MILSRTLFALLICGFFTPSLFASDNESEPGDTSSVYSYTTTATSVQGADDTLSRESSRPHDLSLLAQKGAVLLRRKSDIQSTLQRTCPEEKPILQMISDNWDAFSPARPDAPLIYLPLTVNHPELEPLLSRFPQILQTYPTFVVCGLKPENLSYKNEDSACRFGKLLGIHFLSPQIKNQSTKVVKDIFSYEPHSSSMRYVSMKNVFLRESILNDFGPILRRFRSPMIFDFSGQKNFSQGMATQLSQIISASLSLKVLNLQTADFRKVPLSFFQNLPDSLGEIDLKGAMLPEEVNFLLLGKTVKFRTEGSWVTDENRAALKEIYGKLEGAQEDNCKRKVIKDTEKMYDKDVMEAYVQFGQVFPETSLGMRVFFEKSEALEDFYRWGKTQFERLLRTNLSLDFDVFKNQSGSHHISLKTILESNGYQQVHSCFRFERIEDYNQYHRWEGRHGVIFQHPTKKSKVYLNLKDSQNYFLPKTEVSRSNLIPAGCPRFPEDFAGVTDSVTVDKKNEFLFKYLPSFYRYLHWRGLSSDLSEITLKNVGPENLACLTKIYQSRESLRKKDVFNFSGYIVKKQRWKKDKRFPEDTNGEQLKNGTQIYNTTPRLTKLFILNCGVSKLPIDFLSWLKTLNNLKMLSLVENYKTPAYERAVTKNKSFGITDTQTGNLAGALYSMGNLKSLSLGSYRMTPVGDNIIINAIRGRGVHYSRTYIENNLTKTAVNNTY